jgi:hypothetical protein
MTRTPLDRGWQIVPVPAHEKGPRSKGWPDLRLSADEVQRHLDDGGNIGVRLGRASGELVDIDLDCPEALALADLYLPSTQAEFGRASKPRSHRLYIAPGAAYESFADPINGATLLELRADGRDGGAHQTLFPPSVADSERREWHGAAIVPLVVNTLALRLTVARLAVGSLVMRYVSEIAARHPGPDLPDLLLEFDRELGRAAYRWLGLPDPDAPRRYPKARREMTEREVNLAEIVHAIPNNNCGWDEWNAVGLAIYAVDPSDHGGVIFDDWSAKASKYNPYTTADRWRHFYRSPPSRTGLGKLIALAREAGWRPSEREAS